jgi:anti-anti-sigma regulatory factor
VGPDQDHADEQVAGQFVLPSVLDLTAAEPLCLSLLERLSVADSMMVVGTEVERVSTAAIQVLLAAAADARARGVAFRLEAPSETLVSALQDLGLAANFVS